SDIKSIYLDFLLDTYNKIMRSNLLSCESNNMKIK
ncbi:MAG: hypothetical protein QG635_223, partial [Bacteroidota bacterium]|nr:hypothetical protein [Bacteroidota bacterium]